MKYMIVTCFAKDCIQIHFGVICRDEHHFVDIMYTAVDWKQRCKKYGDDINDIVSDLSKINEYREHYKENSEKCKEYIALVHRLFKLGKKVDAPPIYLYTLVRNGYWAASTIFNYTQHKRQRMFFHTEAVNFAKTAQKFSSALGKEVVEPEKWQQRRITVDDIGVDLD